jgi:hypothetical protein
MTPIGKSLLDGEPELFGVELTVPTLLGDSHGMRRFAKAIALECSSFCAQAVRCE